MTAPAATKTGTPYDTAQPYISTAMPSWVASNLDKLRLACYDFYDAVYRNVVGTFILIARGSENNPIYVPSGKTIVESCHRFLAVGFDYTITGGTPEAQAAAKLAMDQMFRRNKFWSKFTTQKRYGLIRGDAMWHVIAYPDVTDPAKRIKILELDPRTYFPIARAGDATDIVGCYIIQRMTDPLEKGKKIIKRQWYQILDTGLIQSTMNYFPEDKWDDRINPDTMLPYHEGVAPLPAGRYTQQVLDEASVPVLDETGAPVFTDQRGEMPFLITLDPRITAIPVYHIKNTRAPNDPFGVSEMSGIERLIAGINQGISDEELALALEGLGLYWTNSGPPTDDQGNPTNWVLGPGRVVEIDAQATFGRVTGVSSVAPSIQHLDWLMKAQRESSATANIAIGIVDSQTNLSGIALQLQMAPLLAKNAEKETEMMGEYDNMFNDLLHEWFAVYGVGTFAPELIVSPIVDDALPVDRAEIVLEVTQLVAENIITIAEAQSILQERLGYEFTMSNPEDFMKQLPYLAASRDPFGARLADENLPGGDATNNDTATPPSATPPTPAPPGGRVR